MLASIQNLYFGQSIAVAEIPNDHREQTCNRNLWARRKYLMISRVIVEEDCGRNQQLSAGQSCSQNRAKDRQPYNAASTGIAVNLRQDVRNQICQGKIKDGN